jgi:hypothetical protein
LLVDRIDSAHEVFLSVLRKEIHDLLETGRLKRPGDIVFEKAGELHAMCTIFTSDSSARSQVS